MHKILIAFIVIVCIVIAYALYTQQRKIRISTINLENGGAGREKEFGVLIAQNDIVVVCEVKTHAGVNSGIAIAQNIGWHCSDTVNDCVVLSRWELESRIVPGGTINSPLGKLTAMDLHAVFVHAPRPVIVFPVHLNDEPYQPFNILGVKYKESSDRNNIPFIEMPAGPIGDPQTLILHAKIARGAELSRVLEFANSIYALNGIPQVIAGDFNEPSHLDWTRYALDAGVIPMEMQYPASIQMHDANFTDTFRAVHSDEVIYMGSTWPASREKVMSELVMWNGQPISDERSGTINRYISARIDYIYCKGASAVSSERKLTPSDHYAIESVISV